MKIRGRLVLSVVLSMMFMALILYAYVFAFLGKNSLDDLKNLSYLKGIITEQLEHNENFLHGAGRSFLEDAGTKQALDRVFPGGWLVFTDEGEILNRKNVLLPDKDRALIKTLPESVRKGKTKAVLSDRRTFLCFPLRGNSSGLFVAGATPFSASGRQGYGHFVTGLGAILLFGIFGVSFILYIMTTKHVIRPMIRIGEAAFRISQKDFERNADAPGPLSEAQALADSVEALMRELKEYHSDIEEKIRMASEENRRYQKNLIIAQRLAATGKLASGIAHEINNPLGGMMNAVHVLKKDLSPSGQKVKDYFDLIEDGLSRIRETVRKILLFQRTDERGGLKAVSLGSAVQKALFLIEHRIKEKNLQISCEGLDELPRVMGDANELQQAFLNILMNAADAVAPSGRIALSGRREEKKVCLEFSDNGCGIKRESLHQVFDFFYTTKAAGEGTGLGLPIVYNIVRNHGGDIEIDSKEGQGTRVKTVFPAAELQEEGGRAS